MVELLGNGYLLGPLGAVGAIGTVATFATAIFLADSSDRDRRRTDAAVLYGVAHVAGSSSGMLSEISRLVSNGQNPRAVARGFIKAGGLSAHIDELSKVNIVNFPSVRMIDSLNGIKDILKTALVYLQSCENGEDRYLKNVTKEMLLMSIDLSSLSEEMKFEGGRILKRGIKW